MQHKDELINLSIEKSNLAIKAAKDNINLENLETAQNRIYYGIFYMVTALSYKYDFVTAKHKQLMGWFNKKFIYEDKIFDENMLEIYKRAFLKRQESDYEAVLLKNKEQLEESLKEAIFFVEEIKKYLFI